MTEPTGILSAVTSLGFAGLDCFRSEVRGHTSTSHASLTAQLAGWLNPPKKRGGSGLSPRRAWPQLFAGLSFSLAIPPAFANHNQISQFASATRVSNRRLGPPPSPFRKRTGSWLNSSLTPQLAASLSVQFAKTRNRGFRPKSGLLPSDWRQCRHFGLLFIEPAERRLGRLVQLASSALKRPSMIRTRRPDWSQRKLRTSELDIALGIYVQSGRVAIEYRNTRRRQL